MPIISIWGSERDIGKSKKLTGRISYYLRNYKVVDGYGLDETKVTYAQLLDTYQ